MTDYRTIDAEQLREELGGISDVLREAELSDDEVADVEQHMGNINGLIHSFNKLIQTEDRNGGFQVVISRE